MPSKVRYLKKRLSSFFEKNSALFLDHKVIEWGDRSHCSYKLRYISGILLQLYLMKSWHQILISNMMVKIYHIIVFYWFDNYCILILKVLQFICNKFVSLVDIDSDFIPNKSVHLVHSSASFNLSWGGKLLFSLARTSLWSVFWLGSIKF